VRVGIISTFVDYHRRGRHHRSVLQPQAGALIAALLPPDVEVEVINDAWTDPDWERDYDLLFLSSLHSDFDRARQISHYWRRRGARTVLGGSFASLFPQLAAPHFDALVIGDPESTVARVYQDFCHAGLAPVYRAGAYDPLAVPTPRYDLLAGQQWLPISLEVTRGCPYACEFCALTGLGTRHRVRPVERVVQDILAGQRMLGPDASWYRRRIVGFYDNNLGGDPAYLRRLCAALEPLNIWWGACVTFNVLCQPELLDCMARAGCRGVFVGLESLNAATLANMRKFQNLVGRTRQVIDQCHRRGILVMSGIMLSPETDTPEYIEALPELLAEAGLHVPTYVCFETPLPGTPHFRRLAADDRQPLMPDALLSDFNAYTLVTRPRHASAEDFVAAFRRLERRVHSPLARLRKFAFDAPRLLTRGGAIPLLFDLVELASESSAAAPGRSFVAGRDLPLPELSRVPFADGDFDSEAQRDAVLEPWRVTDGGGRVLTHWLDSGPIYGRRGRVAFLPSSEGWPGEAATPAAAVVPAPA
jgi:hypothetical protein